MRILRQLEANGGQGLLEVVAVIGVFGALLGVAMPGYFVFEGRKADKTAKSNLLAAMSTAETYRAKHGSYVGMNALSLYKIDPRIPSTLAVASAARARYCLTDNVRGKTWSVGGPFRANVVRFRANADCTRQA